jgi:hypothetical protein
MKLNIPRPSADAPEAMALYEKLRAVSEDPSAEVQDDAVMGDIISGLFNIVAKLEAQSRAK